VRSRPEPRVSALHLAVFLLSLLALLFEFAQTRLFSATLDYHLTFLVLSGALLGVAGGATCSAVLDGRTLRPSSAALAIAAGIATLVALLLETRVDPMVEGTVIAVAAGYVLGIVPLAFVSWVIVRALREAPAAGGGLYAADLGGAAMGSLLGYLLIGGLGAQGLYGLAAASAFVAGALLLRPGGARSVFAARAILGVVALIAVVGLSVFGEVVARPLAGPLKAPDLGSSHDFAAWDPLARIDVSRAGGHGDPFQYAFLIDDRFTGSRPDALAMYLDQGALTPILADGPSGDQRVLDASILAAPYALASRPSVLVVGPGGGIDILMALRHGTTAVTAVEVNRTVVALMRGRYAEYSGGVYLDPRAHIFEDEARSFIRRSTDRFDLIAITVVDSFAALSVGAYALTENYLYTDAAMTDYLRHLSPDGAVALSRWYRDPPVEMTRTVAVARAALANSGVAEPLRSIAVLRYGNFGLAIIRPRPFSEAEMSRLRDFAALHRFTIELDPLSPSVLLAAPPRDAPPTDDRPFFFDTVPLGDVLSGSVPLPYGYAVLITTFMLSAALAIGVVLLPVYRDARIASASLVPLGTLVALAIGLGFITAEVVLLQRLTLYLGQPSLALSVGLAALLVGAASGSALSARAPGGIRGSALASSAALFITFASLPVIADATLAAPLAVRLVIGLLAAYLVGLPLGTVFPRVISTVGRVDASLVSWVWAANGTASVAGAVLGTAVALAGGFTVLGLVACACYLVAAVSPPDARARPAKTM
jgi:hypothetical protein